MKQDEIIDLELYPSLKGIVEKPLVRNKDLHIQLKKPVAKIIVTIKPDYTAFRKEIERLLKEKGVEIDDRKNILNFVDCSHDIIYKDASVNFTAQGDSKNDFESDPSDPSDRSEQMDTHEETKIVNISGCLKLDSGSVKVSGNIVGLSEPFKMISSIERKCDCGKTLNEFNPPLYNLDDTDASCPECNKRYKNNREKIKYRNAITVNLQDSEKFSDIEKLTCILLDIPVENIRPGERIIVTGDIHIRPKSNTVYLIPKVFSEKIEYINKEQITVNDKDTDAIKRLVKLKGNKIIESLVDMFDPSIIGNNIAKEALLFSLVSTGNDLEVIRKHRSRTRINVLFAGKPGLAKSSLLRKTVSLISNSRYESVQHSSGKSMTAIIQREDESHFLRLGPIPMASASICALNEIGTMSPDDQNLLLDLMEEGYFTINKYGFNTSIQSPTAIIGSTNFAEPGLFGLGRFKTQSTTYPIPLSEQLLDRFDIIVILEDNGNIEALKEYVQKKTKLQYSIIPNYDVFIQKFIEYARNINPKLSPEASEMIKQYYLKLCESGQGPQSRRKLETIIRLCKAVSKLSLKLVVDGNDVAIATSFYNTIIWKVNGLSAPIPKDPLAIAVEECVSVLRENKDSVLFMELIKRICSKNEDIRSYLLGESSDDEIDDKKLSIDKNKKVRKISEILRSHNNVKVVNKNPIKLQFVEESDL